MVGGGTQERQATALGGWRPYEKAKGAAGMMREGVAGTATVCTNIHAPYFLVQHPHSGTWPPRIKTILPSLLSVRSG